MGAIESRIGDNASAVNGELLDIQRKQQVSSLIERFGPVLCDSMYMSSTYLRLFYSA